MAASWIAQIGEEGLSETEAVDSFIAMNEQRKRTGPRPRNSRRQHERIADFSHRVQQCEIVRMVPGSCDSQRVGFRLPWTLTGHRKIFVLDCARKTGVFVAKRRVIGRLNVRRSNTTRMDGTAPAVFSGLTFLHTVDEESVWSAATWSGQSDEDAAWATGSPGIPPGHLIVDSAAGEALIGEAACVRWEQKLSDARLRGVRVHCKMMTPKRGRRCSTSQKIDDDAHYDRRIFWGAAVHCGRRRHPGTVAVEFSGETGFIFHVSEQSFPCIAHQGVTAR